MRVRVSRAECERASRARSWRAPQPARSRACGRCQGGGEGWRSRGYAATCGEICSSGAAGVVTSSHALCTSPGSENLRVTSALAAGARRWHRGPELWRGQALCPAALARPVPAADGHCVKEQRHQEALEEAASTWKASPKWQLNFSAATHICDGVRFRLRGGVGVG